MTTPAEITQEHPMHVRAWAAAGIIVLGLGLGVLSGFGLQLAGQAIVVAPYLLFALVAACSGSPMGALKLSGTCLVLHAAFLQQAASDDVGLEVMGAFLYLVILGPGFLALLALGILIRLGIAWLRDSPERTRF